MIAGGIATSGNPRTYGDGYTAPGANADFGGTRANGVTYMSPRFAGVQATFQHGAGTGRELVESTATNPALTDSANVRNGLMFNYNGVKSLDVSYAHTLFNSRNNLPTTTTDYAAKLHQLGASYTFPMAKVSGTFNKGTRDESVAGTSQKYQSQQIGIEGLFGALRPYLQIGSGTVYNTNAAGVETTSGDYKTQQFGVRYDLSKRTTAYFMMGTSKDDAAVNGTGMTAANYLAKREVTALGIYHAF